MAIIGKMIDKLSSIRIVKCYRAVKMNEVELWVSHTCTHIHIYIQTHTFCVGLTSIAGLVSFSWYFNTLTVHVWGFFF